MKRLVLVVSSLVLIFQVAFPPQQARAAEPINFKRANPSKFTHPFTLSRDKITFFSDYMTQQKFNQRFDALEKSFQEDSYFVTSNGNDNVKYIVFDKTKPVRLQLYEKGNYYYFSFTRLHTYEFVWHPNKNGYYMRQYDDDFSSNGQLAPREVNRYPSGDIISLVAKQRIEYPDGYTGDTFVGGDSPVLEITRKKECDNLDFVCFFKKALSSTISTIQDLFKGITHLVEGFFEFLKNIFIPSDTNFFAGFFKQMDAALHKKLGFLTFPFDFFTKSFNAFAGSLTADNMSEWHCRSDDFYKSSVCSGVCVDNLLSNNEVCLRFGALEENFPQIWNAAIPLARLGVVLSLLFAIFAKFKEVTEI